MNIVARMDALQDRLEYRFNDPLLLQLALTHKSFRNEQPAATATDDNERLEFLGDALLDLFIAEQLFEVEPSLSEGEMTRVRAEIVSESGLAEVARALELGECLRLGRGERRSGGQKKESLQANALEALMGAIFRDSNWQMMRQVAKRLFSSLIADTVAQGDRTSDSKSKLQELLQAYGMAPPEYRLVGTDGPDHDRCYSIEVLVEGKAVGCGQGRSKKLAQQAAASQAIEALEYLRQE